MNNLRIFIGKLTKTFNFWRSKVFELTSSQVVMNIQYQNRPQAASKLFRLSSLRTANFICLSNKLFVTKTRLQVWRQTYAWSLFIFHEEFLLQSEEMFSWDSLQLQQTVDNWPRTWQPTKKKVVTSLVNFRTSKFHFLIERNIVFRLW